MKRIILYSICLMMLGWTGCSKDEALSNEIDFTSPYAILTDNPNDSIQHQQYKIYKKYQVAVFLNDTVSKTLVGNNLDGSPRYQYETIDLNWNFTAHNQGTVSYSYKYITDPEKQKNALDFADYFLGHSDKKMHPFCMLMVDGLTIKDSKSTIDTTEFGGFRTLVLADSNAMTEEEKAERSGYVLRKLVKWKVSMNKTLLNEFGEISKKNNYYGREWVADLGCQPDVLFSAFTWGASRLYKFNSEGEIWSFISYMNKHGYPGYSYTFEQFEEDRKTVFKQIGTFGFICGNINNGGQEEFKYSPTNVDDDLNYYIDQILILGKEEFLNRYGESPLVLLKYNMLVDYIENELEVKL